VTDAGEAEEGCKTDTLNEQELERDGIIESNAEAVRGEE
jgi:hypothetical protein